MAVAVNDTLFGAMEALPITRIIGYTREEVERISCIKWCLGEKVRHPVSNQEAVNAFKTDRYDGITPEDYFHIDMVRRLSEKISRDGTPVNGSGLMSLLHKVDFLFELSGEGLEKVYSHYRTA